MNTAQEEETNILIDKKISILEENMNKKMQELKNEISQLRERMEVVDERT